MPSEKFYTSDSVEGDGSEILEVSWSTPGQQPEGYEGVYVSTYLPGEVPRYSAVFNLDRSGLNRLIKSLRRARNTTYGVDE